MATIMPGHHHPVKSRTPRLMRKIPPEIPLAMRCLSLSFDFASTSVVILILSF
jgi:hypothetical protein